MKRWCHCISCRRNLKKKSSSWILPSSPKTPWGPHFIEGTPRNFWSKIWSLQRKFWPQNCNVFARAPSQNFYALAPMASLETFNSWSAENGCREEVTNGVLLVEPQRAGGRFHDRFPLNLPCLKDTCFSDN